MLASRIVVGLLQGWQVPGGQGTVSAVPAGPRVRRGPCGTVTVDRIEFEAPFGLLGRLVEGLVLAC